MTRGAGEGRGGGGYRDLVCRTREAIALAHPQSRNGARCVFFFRFSKVWKEERVFLLLPCVGAPELNRSAVLTPALGLVYRLFVERRRGRALEESLHNPRILIKLMVDLTAECLLPLVGV